MGARLRRSSHQKARASGAPGLRAGLLATCTLGGIAVAGAAHPQPGVTPQAQPRTVDEDAPIAVNQPTPQRLNPTGRAISLTVPLKDGALYLGDIVLAIDANDRLSFSSSRLLDLLSNIVDPKIVETLRGSLAGKAEISPSDLAGSGVTVTYDPQRLELNLAIPATMRAARSIQVAALNPARFGKFTPPAHASAYVNIRASEAFVEAGTVKGAQDPVVLLDGAARVGHFVVEGAGVWQPGVAGARFQRQDTRLVYDDTNDVIRFSLGDLTPVAQDYQSSLTMAGFSAYRSYSVLEPQRVARPTGQRSFTLNRPSQVEVYVNGQLIRRVALQPGTYNLSDFPFTQGANDVRLAITDDTGRVTVLRFNIFFNQTQLAKGLSEFGLYAGVEAPLGATGPIYTDQFMVSGFYRRGITDDLTLGFNAQADHRTQMEGLDAVLATSIGTLAGQVALSTQLHLGNGWAGMLTFQRLFQSQSGRSDSFNASVQYTSRNFAPVGTVIPNNAYSWQVAGGYTHTFNSYVYAGLDLNFSKGRDGNADVQNYRATVGYRLSQDVTLSTDVLWEETTQHTGVAALLSLTWRLGQYSSVRGDFDTRQNDARVTYQTLHGVGVGSYNINADIERADNGSGVNGSINYIANRAELGLDQFSTFTGSFGSVSDERTSLRIASSIAVADGAVAIGRPIYDAFAVVTPFKTLKGAPVVVDPTPYGFQATTGALGAATEPNMASYNEHTVTVDAPTAPPGVDLGQGAYRMLPPYRAGYHLVVGSEYYVTALGRMLGDDGAPISLVSGRAIELAHPDREPVVVFTNREGRFGLAGLRPGKWRIDMLTDPKTAFVIDIPESTQGVVRLGDLKPANGQ